MKPRIKELIVARDLKQKDVAMELGVTPQQLSNWVKGVSYPRMKQAFKLAKFLECKVDDLYVGDVKNNSE
ncbi:helix-turn-helix transcriptional regulator [Rossellomorea aquimaris]|uniref:helix-turn-helix transcriptional regulator n=1 Tax=Rossellomorea aquimaris TaxID=189382 RepID=UPI0011E94825|nr:helix-turn-helix transcriptional regulator [Rossellomorea aquimaris]TYS91884.1 helix-turn-helix transcriptional regulator [Rossellomorea aquimaris]